MRTYVKIAVPRDERIPVLRRLLKMPLEALARMNTVQAEHWIAHTVAALHEGVPANDRVAVCATRASALALSQARAVAAKLAQFGIPTTLLNVTTTGDRIQNRSLAEIGTQSIFVKELEVALREGQADYAVHSCKDLPGTLPPDMRIIAISVREDPRDVFCSERFSEFSRLPRGARVGTSSSRRKTQLAHLRSDLHYVDIRGNVDTRLRKLHEGEYDAIVLAAAGLHRLGMRARYTVPFSVNELVPAVGQGALAVEIAAGNDELAQTLRAAVNDEIVERCILCERAALRALQGGCQAPIGIHARYEGDEMTVDGAIGSLDDTSLRRTMMRAAVRDAAHAEELGRAVSAKMLEMESAG